MESYNDYYEWRSDFWGYLENEWDFWSYTAADALFERAVTPSPLGVGIQGASGPA